MADKGDKGFSKPNRGLLPVTCHVPSLVFSNANVTAMYNYSNTAPKAYNLMTNSTCTLTKKMYSGSCGVSTSTGSSMYPIASLQSNAFGESAFKVIQSTGAYNAGDFNKTSVVFGTANSLGTLGVKTSSSSLLGVEETEMSELDKTVDTVPTSEIFTVSESDVFGNVEKLAAESFRKGPVVSFQKPAIILNPKPHGDNISTGSSTLGGLSTDFSHMPRVFGKLPINASLGYNTGVDRSIKSLLGDADGISQHETEECTYTHIMESGGFARVRPTFSMSYSISGVFVNYDSNICITSTVTTPIDGVTKPSVKRTVTSSTVTPGASGGISSVLSPTTPHEPKQNQQQTQDEQSQSSDQNKSIMSLASTSDSVETGSQIQSCSEPQLNKRKHEDAFSGTEENSPQKKHDKME